MTNPNLSITVSDDSKTRLSIGRVYQHPDNNLPKNLRYAKAKELIIDGQVFPSITNVIGVISGDFSGWAKYMMQKYIMFNLKSGAPIGQIVKDAVGSNDRYTQYACDKGSEVHQAAEDYINFGKEDHNFQYDGQRYYNSFLQFIEDYNPRFISVETTVYGETSKGHKYAGTIDFIAEINGKIYAGDWKTSKTLHSEVGIQLSAGIKASKMVSDDGDSLEDMIQIDGAIGVHLTENGYSVAKIADVDECWETFESLRDAWNWKAFGGNLKKDQLISINSVENL